MSAITNLNEKRTPARVNRGGLIVTGWRPCTWEAKMAKPNIPTT